MTKVSHTLVLLRCTWFEDLHKIEKPIPSLIESSYLHSLFSASIQIKMHIVREMLKINLLSHNYDIHPLVGPLNSIVSLGEFLNSAVGNLIRQVTKVCHTQNVQQQSRSNRYRIILGWKRTSLNLVSHDQWNCSSNWGSSQRKTKCWQWQHSLMREFPWLSVFKLSVIFPLLVFLLTEWKTCVCTEFLTEPQIKEQTWLIYFRPTSTYNIRMPWRRFFFSSPQRDYFLI